MGVDAIKGGVPTVLAFIVFYIIAHSSIFYSKTDLIFYFNLLMYNYFMCIYVNACSLLLVKLFPVMSIYLDLSLFMHLFIYHLFEGARGRVGRRTMGSRAGIEKLERN